jgi:D-glycero-alpha-D-manno-heptose-7-phosphate kinase
MIISQTPFRISFFGGGTDFPGFYNEHGGAVLATAIDKYCYISIHKLGPFFKYKVKANYARTESVGDTGEIQHPLIRETLKHLDIKDSLEISHVADLPGRTGLGTSSSFTVGLLHALHRMKGDHVGAEDLAREAITIERERVGDAGGHQDQYAAAYGGFLRIDFAAGQRITVKPLPLTHHRRRELLERLMLFYTGVEQSAEQILSEQTQRIGKNKANLQDMLKMVDRAEQIVCGGNLDAFGDLLHETWQLKRGLSNGISNTEIDRAYEAARKAGARGGKLLGAGGRGFLLLYAEPASHVGIRKALAELKEVDFKFSAQGSRVIFQTQE